MIQTIFDEHWYMAQECDATMVSKEQMLVTKFS